MQARSIRGRRALPLGACLAAAKDNGTGPPENGGPVQLLGIIIADLAGLHGWKQQGMG